LATGAGFVIGFAAAFGDVRDGAFRAMTLRFGIGAFFRVFAADFFAGFEAALAFGFPAALAGLVPRAARLIGRLACFFACLAVAFFTFFFVFGFAFVFVFLGAMTTFSSNKSLAVV
jgi:hypothetical protein